jgi:hypothetical protein
VVAGVLADACACGFGASPAGTPATTLGFDIADEDVGNDLQLNTAGDFRLRRHRSPGTRQPHHETFAELIGLPIVPLQGALLCSYENKTLTLPGVVGYGDPVDCRVCVFAHITH